MCVCACKGKGERKREGERESARVWCASVCVCVCAYGGGGGIKHRETHGVVDWVITCLFKFSEAEGDVKDDIKDRKLHICERHVHGGVLQIGEVGEGIAEEAELRITSAHKGGQHMHTRARALLSIPYTLTNTAHALYVSLLHTPTRTALPPSHTLSPPLSNIHTLTYTHKKAHSTHSPPLLSLSLSLSLPLISLSQIHAQS
jgi:hypothetical protein